MKKKGTRRWGVVRVRMRVRYVYNYTCSRDAFLLGPQKKNVWNKWKNHFYEMKGDVGMSLHEKGRNKKMPTPRHKVDSSWGTIITHSFVGGLSPINTPFRLYIACVYLFPIPGIQYICHPCSYFPFLLSQSPG